MGADAVFISYSHDTPELLPLRVPSNTAAPPNLNGAC
jgi:hypothetical protein